jgi:hypothetical protein
VVVHEEGHDAVALRCKTQATIFESLPDSLRIHKG